MSQIRNNVLLFLVIPVATAVNFFEFIAPSLTLARVIDKADTTENLVNRFGYTLESFRVETEDGYFLTLNRLVQANGKANSKKGPILFQHGVLSASDSWLLRGPDSDLAYLLLARGYDVWLNNCRGNTYSRRHRHLNATDPQFWSFSFHEMGKFDLPAVIDFILARTKQKSLNYIGHSMGSTVLFVMLSLRPEYNTKIRLAVCMAPVVYFRKTPSPQLQAAIALTPKLAFLLKAKNRCEFLPRQKRTTELIEKTCFANDNTAELCFLIYSEVFGSHGRFFNRTLFPEILKHYPAGTSVNTMLHFAQNFLSGSFRPMSVTRRGVYDLYGPNQPENYNINNVRAPIALYYSSADILATSQDVVFLAKRLRNLRGIYRIPFNDFTHGDFIWADRNGTDQLYAHIMKILMKS